MGGHAWLLLLLALLGSCRSAPSQRTVLLLTLREETSLSQCIDGLMQQLDAEGWREGVNLRLERIDCGGERERAATLLSARLAACKAGQPAPDCVVSFTTPMAQAALDGTQSPVLISYCFDAPRAAADHPRTRWSGLSMLPPVDPAVDLARELGLGRVGVVWNPAEAHSARQVERFRERAAPMGIELIEAHATGSADLEFALARLEASGIDGVWKLGDLTLAPIRESLIRTLSARGLPVIGDHHDQLAMGARAVVSLDFAAVGRVSGAQLARLLNGEPLPAIAVERVESHRVQRR